MENLDQVSSHYSSLVDHEFEIKTKDDLSLYGWGMDAEVPVKGNVLIVHGMKDYSERYLTFARKLSKSGFNTFAFDLRGHGRSEGIHVYIESMELLLDDLKRVIHKVKKHRDRAPWILLGHSAGGSLVARYATEHPQDLTAFILSAPALKRMSNINRFTESVLRLADKVTPRVPLVELKNEYFSRDPEEVRKLKTDPLIHNQKIPARTARVFLDNMDYLDHPRTSSRIPFFIMHGSKDRINNIEGSKKFYDQSGYVPLKEIKVYHNLSHDLFHEPEHAHIEKDVIRWICKVVSSH
jgi:acylglycerol lipase